LLCFFHKRKALFAMIATFTVNYKKTAYAS